MSESSPPILVETSHQRFDVFLSHNSREKPVVERLAEKLKREGVEPWLDKWCLTPAGDWQNELAQGLQASAACAVFVGPSGIGSWEDLEYKLATDRMAKDRAFRVFLVLLPGLPEPFDTSGLPPFLSTRTWIDLRKGIEDARSFQSLINGIKGLPLGPERDLEPRNDICPYRGLQTFDEDHAEFFFGRDADIQRLIEKLKVTRFIAVLGSSGSGKSSLVRAGVLPALKKGELPQSDTWKIRVLTPTAHPLAALAANLLRLYPQQAMTRTVDELSADERTLHLAVSLALADSPAATRVVWVVDQFEEIFTLCTDEKERAQFLANLLYAAFIPGGRNAILLTLRADFYQKCAAYPELSARVAAHQFLVSPMDENNLKQAIEEPAWHVGLEFEQGLVETILNDVESQPGALPLLEHALLELWERRRGTVLSLEAYRESGGVKGAIAKRADTIYDSFGPQQQTIVRHVMLRLTQPGEGTEDTRRRATREELVSRPSESNAVEDVVQEMTNARLLITSTGERSDEQTIEVSHEALIRGWPRLRKWIEEDRAGLRILRRLTEIAREWQAARDESLLYRGARLAQAVEYRERNEAALNELERKFLDTSVTAQQAGERRRKRIIIGLAAGLVIAAVLAALAVFQWRRANQQALIALSRQLAAQSLALMENQPDLGLLLSVEANRVHESLDARSILLVDMQYREYLTAYLHGHTAEIHKIVFSPDGRLLASASGTNGRDNSVRIWDSSSGQPIGEGLAGHQGEVFCVTFSNDGKILASGDAKGVVILWDVSTRQPLGQPITGHPGIVYSLAFSPDSSLLAVGTFNLEDFKGEFGGEIHLWNVVTHERIGEPIKGHAGAIDTLAFSPDGKTLASGSFAQSYVGVAVILWDVATHRPVGSPMKGHTGGILSLAFSPDGKVLASGSEDNTLRLWDVAGRKPLANYDLVNARNPHKSEVLSVQFMRDGKTLISADSGNHILIQELEFSPAGEKELSLYNSTLKKSISGSTRAKMQSLAFSPQTLMWATGACRRVGSDGTCVEGELSTWSIAARLPISHPINEIDESFASLPSLTLSPNGETLGYGGCGEVDGESRKCIRGEVHLWNTATRQLIHQLKDVPGRVTSLAYSPDGKLLAVGSCTRVESLCKGNIRLWSPDTQQFISQSLAGHRRSVNMLAFSRDGKILASSDGEDLILWNIETRQALGEIAPGHKSKQENMVNLVTSIAFSADGKTLASSGCGKIERRVIAETPPTDVCTEGEIRLWDVKTRQLLGKPFAGHTDVITDVAFSPDGKMLASVSGPFDGTIQLWDIATRQPLGAFTGYVTLMSNVMFSPDGKTLVSLSHPSRREGPSTDTICLWDVATRQLIGQPIAGPDNFIYDIAYSFDGRKLVSFGSGRVLLLWDMDLDSWMAGACRIANRNLNSAEWERYFPNQPYHQTCPNFSTPGRN